MIERLKIMPFATIVNNRISVISNSAKFQNLVWMVPRAGFEPATTRSTAERSPRLSYLGNH